MKRAIFIVSVFLLIMTNISPACWFDTGWITYIQPNGVKFTARMWGDEYESFFETKDGFSIEKNHSDDYYYYAGSSDRGKFIFTKLKVGIDKPVGIAKNLVKTNPFVTKPQRLNSEMNQTENNRLAKVTVTNYTLKVLLVEFQDVRGRNYYTRANFKSMLDGSNYTTSPDGEAAFGSMNQYYNSMANGNVVVNATVLNSSSGDDIPTWVRLSYNKIDYKNFAQNFFSDAYNAGVAAGYDLSTSSMTKLVYIYAGNYYGDGLNPQASGSSYMMSEVWSGGYNNEGTVANGFTFTHIGIHCHEFGHLLGLYDIYSYWHGIDWSLMADGCDMGNTIPHKGQCPAPIDPHQRYTKGWVSVVIPTTPNSGLNFVYDGSNPTIYRIVSGSDIYYFENRLYQDYGRFCPDYSGYSGSGGIMVWHRVELIEADGEKTRDGNFGDLWPGSSGNRNLNDFTSVNCKKYDGTNSSIIMHSVSDPGTTMTAVLGGKWFGTLPSSLTFNGISIIGGNLTIPTGLTLSVSSGSAFQFDGGVNMNINGTLNAVGNSNNSITFTRSGTSGTWGGIQFNSGSSGNLQYCDIYYASNGIYAYNSSPTIKYCTLENNGTAVYCDYFSSPVLVGNNIRYNTYYGIRTNSYSSPNLTDNGYPGSNVIRNNGSHGLYSTYNCNPNLNGYLTYGNSVFNNSGYEVAALYNCTVYAERVYWGSCPPPGGEFYSYQSTINNNNCLSSNPNPGRVIIAGENNNQSLTPVINYSINADEFGLAEEKQKEGKYEEAIGLYLEVFKAAMESSLGRLALIKIEECFTKSGRKNFFEFAVKELKPLIKDKPGLSVVLLELETHQEIIRGNIDKAMKNLDQIINKYNLDEYTDKYTLFRIGSFYIHFYSDVEKAEKIFNQIISKYPNDPLIEEISFLMNMPVYKGQIASNTIIEITDKVKEEYRIENYPNPFNPTTTIQYQIPQDGHISIKIYDMLGREVAQLVNENKKAGEYTISFDASRLASGIYIYKLVGNNVNISKKMILMK